MKTPFNQIVGAKLLNINSSKALYTELTKNSSKGSVFQFGFELDNGYLSIENPFTLTVNEKIFSSSDLEIFDIARTLIGSHVVQAWFEGESINIVFANAQIEVSLKDEDFVSPEAGSFVSNDKLVFIVFTKDDN